MDDENTNGNNGSNFNVIKNLEEKDLRSLSKVIENSIVN
jgi:hypothetical protein